MVRHPDHRLIPAPFRRRLGPDASSGAAPVLPGRGAFVPAGRTVGAALALGVLVWLIWLVTDPPLDGRRDVAFLGAAWAVFGAAAWLVHRSPLRSAVVLILLSGVALPLTAGFAAPRGSDDLYRYRWDGRVQAAGIDPYRYAPAAPELVPLRDPVLWPEDGPWCVRPGATDHENGAPLAPGCTLINRPTVHTIYPPVAQAYFLGVHLVAPDGYRPVQIAAALAALATTVLLLLVLPRLGIDRRRAILWAACPAVALEAGNGAHIDVLAACLSGAALALLATAHVRRRTVLGGVLLGLAIATKVTPALLLPAVLRRRAVATSVAVAGAVAVVYLPHVLAVGADVIGYLPGYLGEEGYSDGSRFALLTLFTPRALAAPVAAALMAAVALAVVRAADPDRPWRGAAVMTGAALLVATPIYPWYALLLVLLVAVGARAAWLAVAVAGYVALHARDLGIGYEAAQRTGYGTALVVIVAATLLRGRCSAPVVSPGRRLTSMIFRARGDRDAARS